MLLPRLLWNRRHTLICCSLYSRRLVRFAMHRVCLLGISEIDSRWLIIERSSLFRVVVVRTWWIILSLSDTLFCCICLSFGEHSNACLSNRWCLSSSNESLLHSMHTIGSHFNGFNLSSSPLYNLQSSRDSNGWLIWDTFLIYTCCYISHLSITLSKNASSSNIGHNRCGFPRTFISGWTHYDWTLLCLACVSLILSFKNQLSIITRIFNTMWFFLIFINHLLWSDYFGSGWSFCNFLIVLWEFWFSRCFLKLFPISQCALTWSVVIHCS